VLAFIFVSAKLAFRVTLIADVFNQNSGSGLGKNQITTARKPVQEKRHDFYFVFN
jgi:hypothetical protein